MLKCRSRVEDKSIFTETNFLNTLIEEKVGRKNEKDSIKALILHSESDSDNAKVLRKYLDELNLRATTESDLTVLKIVFSISYISAAIEWADVVIVLVNSNYLSEIKCVDISLKRSSNSLHARHAFKALQHKIYNDNNLIAVAAVAEGTQHECHEFSELKKCIHLKDDFTELKDTILQLYEVNKKIQAIP